MGAAVRIGISRDDNHGWAVVMAYRLNGQGNLRLIDRVVAAVQEAAVTEPRRALAINASSDRRSRYTPTPRSSRSVSLRRERPSNSLPPRREQRRNSNGISSVNTQRADRRGADLLHCALAGASMVGVGTSLAGGSVEQLSGGVGVSGVPGSFVDQVE